MESYRKRNDENEMKLFHPRVVNRVSGDESRSSNKKYLAASKEHTIIGKSENLEGEIEYMVITSSRIGINRVYGCPLCLSQLEIQYKFSLSPFAPMKLVNRDSSSCLISGQSAHKFLTDWIWYSLTGSTPSSAIGNGVNQNRHVPSGQFLVYQVAWFLTACVFITGCTSAWSQ